MAKTCSGSNVHLKPPCGEWTLLFCLFGLSSLSAYDNFSVGGLLPSLQQYFGTTDASAATIKTCNSVANGVALAAMWLFGDFIPKRVVFFTSILVWIAISFASLLVGFNHFWIFVVLRALAYIPEKTFRLMITVIQAERFKGSMLARSIMANIFGEYLASLLSSSINSIFVSSGINWRIDLALGPAITIPIAVLSIFFVKSSTFTPSEGSSSVISNAFSTRNNKSYILMVIGFSLGQFFALSLSFWLPTLVLHATEAFPNTFSGLSYPLLMSIIANAALIGTLVGLPIFAYVSQKLEFGSLCCLSFSPIGLTIPILTFIAVCIEYFSMLGQVLAISSIFPMTILGAFGDSFGFSGVGSVGQFMQINLTSAQHRTSAFALMSLVTVIVGIPSSQIVGLLSDSFRSDDPSPLARFYALRNALLCMWTATVASLIMYLLVIRYYKEDVAKALESERTYNVEKTHLIIRQLTVSSVKA